MKTKEWREARKAEGLCIRCDNPIKHKGTGSECAFHLKQSGKRQKKYISKDRRALKKAQRKYKAKNKDAINAQARERYRIKKEESDWNYNPIYKVSKPASMN